MRTKRMTRAILSISLALTVFAASVAPALARPAPPPFRLPTLTAGQAGDPAALVRAQLASQGYTVRGVGLEDAVAYAHMDMASAQFDDDARRQAVYGWYALSQAYTDSRITTYLCGLVYQERYILCFFVAPADFVAWINQHLTGQEFEARYVFKIYDRQTGQWVTDKNFIQKNFGVPAGGGGSGGSGGQTGPTATPQAGGTVPPLSQSICCGKTFGGTLTWSVRIPAGWQVQYIPNDPQNFVAVIVTDPQSTIKIGFWPSVGTDPGTAIDQARNVDEFLDAMRADYQQTHPDFQEAGRQPLTSLPDSGRIWAGHWGAGQDQMWTNFLVLFNPMPYVGDGISRGSFTMQGLEANQAEWNRASAIYEAVLGTLKGYKVSGGGYTAPTGGGAGWTPGAAPEWAPPSVKPWSLRWCPRCCAWEPAGAD
ncbi:MAG: hypothetical protein KJ734_07140, partial [Chloroflexi bacterium]|nr:hypothetical protein [Chloroflexota bacterium]